MRRPSSALLLVALPACARHRAPAPVAVPTSPPVAVSRPAPVRPAPWAVPVALATDAYRRTGAARSVSADGFTVFPYGHGPAALACGVLRACLVQLAPGETLDTPPIVGDTVRWGVRAMREGDGTAAPLVVVTPTDCDLTTNLVLATDQRMYQVLLTAPKCAPRASNFNPPGPATHIAFYYPDEPGGPSAGVVAEMTRPAAMSQRSETSERATTLVVNRRYVVQGDRAIAWRPSLIYDDGERTVIELPAPARREELPVLYALEDDGSRTVVNYSVSNGRYVADRVFRRAALVVRRGKAEHVIRVENRGPTRPGGAS